MQKSKMAGLGGLTNSCEKKRSKKAKEKRKHILLPSQNMLRGLRAAKVSSRNCPNMSQTEGQVKELIRESIGVKSAMLADAVQLELIQRIAASIIEALKRGKKVIFCGNGGSFADSIHLAGEFVPRFQKEHVPLAAIALGANT